MADRLANLVLAALGRAARAPAGTPLVSGKKTPGLFPATAPGRQAAQTACDDGLLAPAVDGSFVLTERGFAQLLEQMSPRQVLDDLARAVEARGTQLSDLIASANALRSEWSGMQRLVASLGPRLDMVRTHYAESDPRDLQSILAAWSGPGDCPLPDLFRRQRAHRPDLTIGRFHDLLRRLHEASAIYLHPWTGPLYTLPEPAFALLVGHEVAYYASTRSDMRSANTDKPETNPANNGASRSRAVA